MSASEIRRAFVQRFNSEPEVVAIAPGRINLIGEHTDYNDGFVFPAAIDRVMLVAASLSSDQSRLYSLQSQEGEPFEAGTVEPNELVGWAKYPAGVAWALRQNGYPSVNLRAVVSSNIPMGSGVSSSAAMELAFLVLHRHFAGFDADGVALAQLGKFAENRFVGVNSGIMDQLASAMGKKDLAMFIDTRSLGLEYAPVPSELKIVLCDTKKERALTSSAYNERRAQCEEAASKLGVKALRDATLDMLEAARLELGDVVYRRARHVITEDSRAQAFKDALKTSDFAEIGKIMRAGHESLRDDFEVSCRELDIMAAAAWDSPGCVGARMTGGGFGGACVALVEQDKVDAFASTLLERYDRESGLHGEAMACSAADGARILTT
jgi:galactokinase